MCHYTDSLYFSNQNIVHQLLGKTKNKKYEHSFRLEQL
jgi:hypothetical protein